MKRPKASDFPELQRVFAGYLHEDFPEEHGTPSAALRAFRQDANAGERRRLGQETRRFLAQTATLDFDEVRALLTRLGSRWDPPSREALDQLLAEIAGPAAGTRGR